MFISMELYTKKSEFYSMQKISINLTKMGVQTHTHIHTIWLLFPVISTWISAFFFFFRAAPAAYEASQARGQIRAVAPGHSNTGSEPHL